MTGTIGDLAEWKFFIVFSNDLNLTVKFQYVHNNNNANYYIVHIAI